MARDQTAEAGRLIDPIAADKIIKDSYVDDGVTGGSIEEVTRMKGVRLENGKYNGTIPKILDTGKLSTKVIVTTGETDKEVTALIGDSVLGYGWDTVSDNMILNLPVNVSKKKTKKLRWGPDLTLNSLYQLKSLKLTKRLCLSVASGFHDFIGIGCPFTLRFKLLMQQLFELNPTLSWDDELDANTSAPWMELISETVQSGSICFPRSTRPANAIGNPSVVVFMDGAFPAFAAAVYLRWQTSVHVESNDCEEMFVATLLCAESKVTPPSGYTIPRIELSGCVLGSRLGLTVVKALQTEERIKPTVVYMLSDSRCSISAIDKSTTALKPFFHNRVGEILDNLSAMRNYCDAEDFHFVSGDKNPADLATRGTAKAGDLGPESYWQCGPSFLRLGRDLWPVTREFVPEQIPVEEVRSKRLAVFSALKVTVDKGEIPVHIKLWDSIENILRYSNNIIKVKNILVRVIRGWRISKSYDVVSADPTSHELEEAESLILLSAMPLTVVAIEEQKLDHLMPKRQGRNIVTKGHLGSEALSAHLGVEALPIIMPQSRAAFLFMYRAHTGEFGTEHKGVVETLARSRAYVWIHRGRDLAVKICKSCPRCIRDRKKLCGQQMARIRPERLVVCRP